ncbi:hypothetical protein Bca101_054246 [Brassica carinata]
MAMKPNSKWASRRSLSGVLLSRLSASASASTTSTKIQSLPDIMIIRYRSLKPQLSEGFCFDYKKSLNHKFLFGIGVFIFDDESRAIKWKTSSLLPHLFTIVRPSLSGKNMASTSEHLLEHQNARAGVQSPKEIFIEIFSYLKPIIAEFYPSVNSIASVSAAVWFT